MLIIFTLLIVDYMLTYWGINANVITEANPLMVWLFTLDFSQGLIIRIIMSAILLLPFYYVRNKRRKLYKASVAFLSTVYICVMGMHLSWIIDYIRLG